MRFKFFDQVAATRHTLHSRKPGQRMFLRQHLTERPAFVWRETFIRSGTLHPFPNCAGVERRLRACALRRRDGVCGRPPLWPAGDPAAKGAACVRPAVSPPVRRPDARCRGPSSVVCRQVRRFGRACRMPESMAEAGTLRNAATQPASGCGSIWRASHGLEAGCKRGLDAAASGTVF